MRHYASLQVDRVLCVIVSTFVASCLCRKSTGGGRTCSGSRLHRVEPWAALIAAILSAAPKLPGPVPCAEHPTWFDPGNIERERAIALCNTCPALPDCRLHYRRLRPGDPLPWPGLVVPGVIAGSARAKQAGDSPPREPAKPKPPAKPSATSAPKRAAVRHQERRSPVTRYGGDPDRAARVTAARVTAARAARAARRQARQAAAAV